MPGRPWTWEEVNILEEHFCSQGTAIIGELPGRTREAIQMKAGRLGLSCVCTTPHNAWTSEEIAVLQEYYPTLASDVVDMLPGRSREATRQKAQKLKLLAPHFWTEEEVQILLSHYPLEGGSVADRFPRHNRHSVCYKASTLGCKRQIDDVGRILHTYERDAEKRGYCFTLTREQFAELIQQECHYCGSPGNSTSYNFTYTGIDRVDSSRGYTPGNTVSCCKHCNRAKWEMSVEEFREWVTKIYHHFSEGKCGKNR